jgi:hypothetical protein
MPIIEDLADAFVVSGDALLTKGRASGTIVIARGRRDPRACLRWKAFMDGGSAHARRGSSLSSRSAAWDRRAAGGGRRYRIEAEVTARLEAGVATAADEKGNDPGTIAWPGQGDRSDRLSRANSPGWVAVDSGVRAVLIGAGLVAGRRATC